MWILWVILGLLAALFLLGLVQAGHKGGIGPFRSLHSWDEEVNAIAERYPAEKRQQEVVFYGASNFTLWKKMEEDFSGYKVQNHGFGGSTDKLLVQFAPKLLFPYEPSVVFFQTGSNDYVLLKGIDEEKIAACMAYKKQMFADFHEKLPNAKFVVMSGLLLPGRSQYVAMTQAINRELRDLCAERDYMYFVDAEEMTYHGGTFAQDLFLKDQIHLNHDGQLLWMENYIRPMLDRLIEEYGLSHLRK